MKKSLLTWGIVLSVLLLSGPVLAAVDEPTTFYALSHITGKGTVTLPQMPDDHLAAIEGGQVCIGCVNVAVVTQFNVITQALVALGTDISQSAIAVAVNSANVGQTVR